MYPKIVRATASILAHGKVVAPVDVLVRMRLLDSQHLDDWRRNRVPYLERVIHGNLTRLSRLLRILRFHAHDLKLVPPWTAYMRWGKGPKQRLRFTVSQAARVAGLESSRHQRLEGVEQELAQPREVFLRNRATGVVATRLQPTTVSALPSGKGK